MRVLFATTSRLPTERANGYCVVKTCEGLESAGADVELWYPDRPQAGELSLQDPLEYYSVRETFLARRTGTMSFPYQSGLRGRMGPLATRAQYSLWGAHAARLARKARPDVCYTIETAVAMEMTLVGVPVVYENHHPKHGRIAKHALRFVARRPRNPGIVTLSTRLRSELVDVGVPDSKLRVIRHAVDPELYRELPGRTDARRRLGLPVAQPIVGYVGRFHALGAEKGIETLIEAIGLVSPVSGVPPILVFVGGPASAEDSYRAFAAKHGVPQEQMRFVGHVRNDAVPLWIRAFDVSAVPFPATHHFETVSPVKLVEYLATGACVLATDLAALREEVEHGVNAWLVPPDAAGIARGLDRLLNDDALRERLGTAAAAALATRTWRARGEEILDFVASVRPM